ncbi:general transcription factor IIH subunit 1-like [Antedon mediterranea]|uniref:general transcription factor IIH subunit 1-like n=1 Tax=Antedon mediterranea TaxID=105859 RepID=UPI003AF4CEB4
MTSSEDVLLIVGQVKHKKTDGSLYLMAERLAWQGQHADHFAISYLYADIRQQKISPEGKPKIQLQIVLHDDKAATFLFNNREGQSAQLQDRNSVKELLQQILPKFKNKTNKELEEKNRMLKEDPKLYNLYKDLVVSGVITAEEFWSSRKEQVEGMKNNQQVGVSAAFLADIKPQADGCNGVKYNLTVDDIQAIFKTYPAVKKTHMEKVPGEISEVEFWKRFFQSHYFHRDRINTGSKDLFAECAKSDEREMQHDIEHQINDPLLNIDRMEDITHVPGYGSSVDKQPSTSTSVDAALIKRFNHHSTRVLSVTESETSILAKQTNKDKSKDNSNEPNHFKNNSTTDQSAVKRIRLKASTTYEDLSTQESARPVSLRLERTERYYHGPMPLTNVSYETTDDVVQATSAMQAEMAMPLRSNLIGVVPSNLSSSVMSELTPGGLLMASSAQKPLHSLYTQDIQREMKRLYTSLSELLRHFWACFPVTNKTLEDRLCRMKANLEQFKEKKLKPFKIDLARQHIGGNLTLHLDALLERAFSKFNLWQAKKMSGGMRR